MALNCIPCHPHTLPGTVIAVSACAWSLSTAISRAADRELLFVGCLTSQQQASVPQGRICTDNFMCCHTEMEAADQTVHLTQSQYTDTGPTSPSADPITPGAWQGSHGSANFLSHWYDSAPKKIPAQAGFEPGIFRSRGGRLTTRPTRRSLTERRVPKSGGFGDALEATVVRGLYFGSLVCCCLLGC